jgi:hypothetical protein
MPLQDPGLGSLRALFMKGGLSEKTDNNFGIKLSDHTGGLFIFDYQGTGSVLFFF